MVSRKYLIFLSLFLLALAGCTRDPKVRAQRYLENGNKFFAREKYKEASIMYRSALKQDLRFGEAWYRLGLTDLKLAAYGDAAQNLRRATSLQPDNLDAAAKLADLYLLASLQDQKHAKDLQNSVKELADQILAKKPDSFDGHRLQGQVLLLQNNPKDAIKEFAAANAAKPLQPDLVVSYFQALALDNQFPEAEKLAYQLIDSNKSYSPMYDLLYYAYTRQNRSDDGEKLLKLKVANNPKNASYMIQLAAHYYVTKQRAQMDAVIQKLSNEKEFPEGRLLAGDFFLFRLREFDHAQDEYEAGIKAFPKDKAIYQKRLVELFATTNKLPEANQLIADILKENSKDADAIAMRAALMLSSGDQQQITNAVNDLQALVAKTPNNHLLRFNLARALLAKNDLEQARLQLEEAIKLRPDFVVAREVLARLYMNRGDSGKALKAADDLIAVDANNLQGHLVRSTALLALGEQDKAREELAFITKTYPQNVDARFQVGYLAWQQKDYKQAEQIFSDLHKANPHDFRGLVGVVETLASQKHMDQALAEMQKAIQAEPERRDLKLGLANLEVRAQKYDQAIELFKTLVQQSPTSADLWLRLGETYRLKGDLNLAINAYRQASQNAPNDPNSLLQLGLLMDGTGRRDQAEPIYEQILRLQPDQPVALNNLAFIKAERGQDLDQALTMAQKARQKLPASPDVADTLGWIYIKKNLPEEAVQIFGDLVAQQPSNATYHYHFGMALLQKGDKSKARAELLTAMRNNPSSEERTKIQELLQKN